jgi:hypothetical protein
MYIYLYNDVTLLYIMWKLNDKINRGFSYPGRISGKGIQIKTQNVAFITRVLISRIRDIVR